MIDDETFFAWLDGTLDPDEHARVSALVAADPALSRRADRQRMIAAHARESFAADLNEPPPDRWLGMIDDAMPPRQENNVASWAAARAARPVRRLWGWAGAAVAVAAAAVVTIGIGYSGRPQPLIVRSDGLRIASTELGAALDKATSGTPYRVDDKAALDIQLSFRTRSDELCRDAVLAQSARTSRFVACRAPQAWQVIELVPTRAGSGSYEAASGGNEIEPLLDRLGAEPLDAAGEAEAIRNGWRAVPAPPVRSGNRRS